MKKVKLYFETAESEHCYPLYVLMATNNYKDKEVIELYEAEPEQVPGMFYCAAEQLPSEEGSCGTQCQHYSPRNKINGICNHKGSLYSHGKKVKFLSTEQGFVKHLVKIED